MVKTDKKMELVVKTDREMDAREWRVLLERGVGLAVVQAAVAAVAVGQAAVGTQRAWVRRVGWAAVAAWRTGARRVGLGGGG
jgi:hypothetical protein